MCSVGDAFEIDISGEAKVCGYICLDCQKEFKGIGSNVLCPACKSGNVQLKEE